ncbi:Potassium voltage-gated channel subfamily G member 3 [Collichthys lucidus]|uniref:Potassium voltage-gated channel subfamily G member 3 n=1 Tax=Collichthys lucidus TaxID=240159 RepID=A0A4U5VMW7_COLLU|nr:Potassium voltage-gated channel subfamily G member 3 [Collichthys lucidus]
MKFGKSICVLNVGGTRYAFTREVIRDFPLRRVSRLHACATEKEVLELCDDYDRDRNEFFFDRHAQAFVFIMLYVRSGKLRFVPGVCELSFYTEMLYWGLESAHLDSCCQKRLDDRMSEVGMDSLSEVDIGLSGDEAQSPDEPVQRTALTGRAKWLEMLRKAFEEPNSSLLAQLLASVSVLFVIVSMFMLCASTLPDWNTAKKNTVDEHRIVEAVCIGWFTAECIVRFLVAKNKWEFLRRPLNIIDVIAITPYYVTMVLARAGMPGAGLGVAGVILRVLRMMRVFWLMKLARHFLGLQTLGPDAHALLPGDGHADGVCLRSHGDIQCPGTAPGARLGLGDSESGLCQHPSRRLVGHHFHDDGRVWGCVPCDNWRKGAWRDVCGERHCPLGTSHHVHLPQFCTVLP